MKNVLALYSFTYVNIDTANVVDYLSLQNSRFRKVTN